MNGKSNGWIKTSKKKKMVHQPVNRSLLKSLQDQVEVRNNIRDENGIVIEVHDYVNVCPKYAIIFFFFLNKKY